MTLQVWAPQVRPGAPARPGLATPPWPRPLSHDEEAAVLGAPWFSGLPAELGRTLLSMGVVRRLGAGKTMARAFGGCGEWYGVARGVVKVYSRTQAGKQVIVSLAQPGDWFGDEQLTDGPGPLHDVQACSPAILLAVHKRELQLLLQREPRLGIVLARLSASRASNMLSRFTDAVSLPLPQRVAVQLLSLARRFGLPCRGGVRITLHLSQQDLADLLGASRQRVNFVLKTFERQGLLQVQPTGLFIACTSGLQAATVAP
ncbi:MAG TPA: Crp/Fnr family transcriptional regulator [Albitalea sp.]|nr:Crp/Fnr family transcriptional regulator [Albitalea sp.]